MEKIGIEYEPIELCKLLKIANLVSGGGEAKIVISMGEVYLNGEVELQKRKKVFAGDIVEFNGDVITTFVESAKPAQDDQASKGTVKQPKTKKQQLAQARQETTSTPTKRSGRRPISF